jgi:cyclophilin family peptidyl-prolyl cis-trans isomerase
VRRLNQSKSAKSNEKYQHSKQQMSVTLITSLGELKIEVYCEQTPKTAKNFLALCASGYYNGCQVIRNIPGFIFQTGDPTSACATPLTSQ